MVSSNLLLLILLLIIIGAFPIWPYSRAWGYYPAGGLGSLLILLILLKLLGFI